MSGKHTSLSSHCLDTAIGKPAAGLKSTLMVEQDGQWRTLAEHSTDDDGRVTGKVWGDVLPGAGNYRMVFHTKAYFEKHGIQSFLYSEIPIQFEITPELAGSHFHIPLLLSPFGYSTYRGS